MPAGTFAPSQLHIDYGEWTPPAIGSADTGKAWVWNNATARYEPAAFEPLGNAASAAAAAIMAYAVASGKTFQQALINIWSTTVGDSEADDANDPESIVYKDPEGNANVTHTLTDTTRTNA